MHSNDTPIPYGYCQCGCGGKTNIVKRTCSPRGYTKGSYYPYLSNHWPHTKGARPDTLKRTSQNTPTDGYCGCGCGGKTNVIQHTVIAKGYVKGNHYPYLPNHHPHAKGVRPETLSRAFKHAPPEDGRCLCGCGEMTEAATHTERRYGWIQGKPKPFVNQSHGDVYRILTGYIVDPIQGCWIWQRACNEDGYGILGMDGHTKAHQWFYARFKGPIPKGQEVDHTCHERACVFPDHLELVTHAENGRRRLYCKITMEEAREIRALHDQVQLGKTMPGNLSREEIGFRYGISAVTVGKIFNGTSWNEDIE